MAGPWEKYAQSEAESKPWDKYTAGIAGQPGKYAQHLEGMPEREIVMGNPDLERMISEMSPLQRTLVGMGKGFVDIGQGAKQIALGVGEKVGLVPEGRPEEYEQELAQLEREYDDPLLSKSSPARFGRFAGQVAATAPVALPFGGAPATIPAAMAQGAVIGGASSALMPTKPGESRLLNTAIGTTLGGLTGGALKGGQNVFQGIRGQASATLSQELMGQSKKFQVPLTVGELRGSTYLKRVEQMLERVPGVGLRGFREKQASSLSKAAKALVERYAGPEDVGEELQSSLTRKLTQNKTVAAELYDKVGEEAAKVGGKVTLDNVKAASKGIVSREAGIPEQFRNSRVLKDVDAFSGLDDLTFDTARNLRTRLGQEIRRMEKSTLTGAVSDEELRAAKMLQGALEEDISAFATKAGGELKKAYKEANKFFKENVVPFKDRMIRKIGTDEFDTDQIVKMFVKNDRPRLAFKLMAKLDQKGQEAIKYSVLKDAFDNALSGGSFSPAKFAARLERLGKSKNAIFNSSERAEIEGFTRLSKAAERAGQYAENPPTGQRAVDAAIAVGFGGGAFMNPVGAFSGVAAAGTLSKLLTTNAGRRLLTRASGLRPESKAMSYLLHRELPRVMALNPKNEKIKKSVKK